MRLTESQSPRHYALSNLVPDALIMKGQSEISADTPCWVTMGKGSFAVSSDAMSVQKRMKELEIELLSCQTYKRLIDSPMVMGLFQMCLNLAGFEKIWGQEASVENKERAQLENRLLATFEAEPLEDGMDHPAERIIRNVLGTGENQYVLDIFRAFSLDVANSSFAAAVLRCLGRQPYLGTVAWRTTLVRDALSINDIEIRDAAVQAAELWGDEEMRIVLEQHSEPEPWFREYISDVLADLGD